MNADIEAAIVAYLRVQLAPMLASFTPAAVIHGRNERAEKAIDRIFSIVACERLPNDVQNLWTAHLAVFVDTPFIRITDDGGAPVNLSFTHEQHSLIVRAMQWAMEPAVDAQHDAAAVTAAQLAQRAAFAPQGWVLAGVVSTESHESHTKTDWLTVLEYRAGVRKL